jgi:hypothetical protein
LAGAVAVAGATVAGAGAVEDTGVGAAVGFVGAGAGDAG